MRAAFRAARDSLEALARNLAAIGYPLPPDPLPRMKPRGLRALRDADIPIPPMLLTFWEEVGGVAFVDIVEYRHTEFLSRTELYGRASFCDGLYLDYPGEPGWTEHVVRAWDDWLSQSWTDEADFVIDVSPDGHHKDDISGGPAYGVAARADGDAKLLHFDWPSVWTPKSAEHPPDLLSYLRTTVLECAGFPGLYGQRAFEDTRLRLLEGVPTF